MEALALGRPVISTYVAGIPELVMPGIDGWLIPAGDAEALADAMQECLETPLSELTKMGDSAFAKVFKYHDIDLEAAKLADCDERPIKRDRNILLAITLPHCAAISS